MNETKIRALIETASPRLRDYQYQIVSIDEASGITLRVPFQTGNLRVKLPASILGGKRTVEPDEDACEGCKL